MTSQKGLEGPEPAYSWKGMLGAPGESEWGDSLSPTVPSLLQHLQEALGLPAARGDAARGDENPEGTPEDKGAPETEEDHQGEEEEEATPIPSSSPSPSASPTPTPEDVVTYICELSLAPPCTPGLRHHFQPKELSCYCPGAFRLLTAQPVAPTSP